MVLSFLTMVVDKLKQSIIHLIDLNQTFFQTLFLKNTRNQTGENRGF